MISFHQMRLSLARLLFAGLAAIVVSGPVCAKTVTEYREEVTHLRKDFAELLTPIADEDPREYADFEGEVFAEVREFARDSDPVRLDGAEIETGNGWMLEKLNEYSAGTGSDADKRGILREVYERLGAIENELYTLERDSSQGATKDENKRKLAKILSGEEFRGPSEGKDDSLVARFLKWIEQWLTYLFPPREMPDQVPSTPDLSAFGFVLQLILYGLIAALIAFLLYKFGPRLFRRQNDADRKRQMDRIVLGERIEAGASTEDLYREAERLVRDGNIREALRKGYIALLFGLGEKKLVGIAKHKTNRDYLNDLRNKGELLATVQGLTSTYERHWYGSSEAVEEDWVEFAGGYSKALGPGRS